MRQPIYLDYMATTPVDDRVVAKMSECLGKGGVFGNPASQSHRYGFDAAQCVREARKQVADLIHADEREIVWTSGATESNNLAIKGAARFYERQGKHIITMATEHKAVLDPCAFLASNGFEVTCLKPEANGLLSLETLKEAIRPDTILVSIMCVNNETGMIQPIKAIGELLRDHAALFHVDAAQAAGKLPLDVQDLNVDLMSFSAHKNYGPKGIGALYVRRTPQVRLEPIIHGGGHERGMRSGTLPTHQIVGMGEAFALSQASLEEDAKRIAGLRDRFWGSVSALGGITLNSDLAHTIPGCLNICVAGVTAESLVLTLRDMAISNGSACNSANPSPSHVLSAMGLSREEAYSSLRISFGRFTTDDELDQAIAHFTEGLSRLRAMSPVWNETEKAVLRKS